MARNSTMSKIEPSVLSMHFTVPAGSSTIDLSQSACILNRRFYRQGLSWAVSGITVLKSGATETGAVGISIARLPSTWSMSNSWTKSFSHWNRQQMDAIEEAGAESAVARFRDFKIHMDVNHVTAGFAANLLPRDYNVVAAIPGEWESSQIVIPNYTADASGSLTLPREFALHAVGPGYSSNSRGMIQGYADSRSFPQSPDPVSPDIGSPNNWMRDMFDVGSESSEISDNATDKNDDLPYVQADYPGGLANMPGLQFVDGGYFSAGTHSNKLHLRGDTYPCGLIRLDSDQEVTIIVHLVPGSHKGYLCEPMQEM